MLNEYLFWKVWFRNLVPSPAIGSVSYRSIWVMEPFSFPLPGLYIAPNKCSYLFFKKSDPFYRRENQNETNPPQSVLKKTKQRDKGVNWLTHLECLGVHLASMGTVPLNTESKYLIAEHSLPSPCNSVPLSSAGFDLKQPFFPSWPVAPSLCSYQHKSLSIERSLGHGSLKKSIEMSFLRWAWATRPSLIQSKQSSDPGCPGPGYIAMPRAQSGETAHSRTHQLGERKEGHTYFPKTFYVRTFLVPYTSYQVPCSKIAQNSVA